MSPEERIRKALKLMAAPSARLTGDIARDLRPYWKHGGRRIDCEPGTQHALVRAEKAEPEISWIRSSPGSAEGRR